MVHRRDPPSAKLPFKRAPMHSTIVLPGAVAHTTLTVAGSLTAKKVGSTNPMSVSPSGVSYSGGNGEVEVGNDGSVGAEVSTTLNGIKNSIRWIWMAENRRLVLAWQGVSAHTKSPPLEIKSFILVKRLKSRRWSMVLRSAGSYRIPWR